ncbi:MAG: PEP-CTERM sorting domain-containing protein [Planctomycetota bacterium]
MQMSKALFGGALMTAGVAANAQSFNFLDTSVDGYYPSFAYIVDTRDAYGPGALQAAYAPDSLDLSLTSANGLSLSTSQDSNTLTIAGTWDGTDPYGYGNAYGGGLIQQFFTTDVDAILRLSWDVTSTDLFATAAVIEDEFGTVLVSLDILGGVDPAAGSIDIPLDAGTVYNGQLLMGTPGFFGGLTFPFFEVPGQEAFLTFELIPAPSSLALLGMGGLAAARRRR